MVIKNKRKSQQKNALLVVSSDIDIIMYARLAQVELGALLRAYFGRAEQRILGALSEHIAFTGFTTSLSLTGSFIFR